MNKKSFALKQKLVPRKFLGSQYFILAFFLINIYCFINDNFNLIFTRTITSW